jgi:hypothetical protein
LDFLKLFEVVDMEHSFLSWGMLSATVNAAKSAQNCPNMTKDETLKFRQKSRF